MRGKFIVFEGIDASGKDTQFDLLKDRLNKEGISTIFTKEPTDNKIGKLIREEYLSGKDNSDKRIISLLMAADRLDHISNSEYGILQYLEKGYNVISNRYILSSYAYDGTFNGYNFVCDINRMAKNLLTADITIYIDIDPKIAFERINTNRDKKEIYENLKTLEEVRESYLDLINFDSVNKKLYGDCYIIEGNDTIENIHNKIWDIVYNNTKEGFTNEIITR